MVAPLSISDFRWTPPYTIASSPLFLFSAILSYLLCTFGLSLLLSKRKSPIPLGPLPVVHNLILFLGSFIMFAGCLASAMEEIIGAPGQWQTLWPEQWKLWSSSSSSSSSSLPSSSRSWIWLFCFPKGTSASGPVFFWSYIFYLSKYYELLDTLIMVLKRRPLTFLHVFHHSVVILMSFLWLEYVQSLQIIALLTNTSVHMLMYSYYLLCTLGIKPPWKKVVTNCQIVQFAFSFAVSIVMVYLHFNGDGCAGFGAWIFNACFNASLLILFVNFHRKQYREARDRKMKKT